MSDYLDDDWLRKIGGEPVLVPMSLLKNKKISWGAKGLYTAICALPNSSNFKPEDLIRPQNTLKQVKTWLKELRKWGYLPDEDAS